MVNEKAWIVVAMALTVALALMAAVLLEREAHSQIPERGAGRAPPPQALAACRGLSRGATCEIRMPDAHLTGSCHRPPGVDDLACVPDDRRAGLRTMDGRPGQSPMRDHRIVQRSGALVLLPATQAPIAPSRYEDAVEDAWLAVTANGIARHWTGPFPNPDNPNSIAEQRRSFRLPAAPELSERAPVTALGRPFGVAVNGVVFDPGAAEFYRGNPRSGWQYEPLSGAIPLGLDVHHAHVQPSGSYHYHGLPSGLLDELELSPDRHSSIIGWAADGFPIYALYGFADPQDPGSSVIELVSGFRLKNGERPQGPDDPGGVYDGTFTRDYAHDETAGGLDECNGRYGVTPNFPDGTYSYFLTTAWPVIPRC